MDGFDVLYRAQAHQGWPFMLPVYSPRVQAIRCSHIVGPITKGLADRCSGTSGRSVGRPREA